MNALQEIKQRKGLSAEDISKLTNVPLPTVYAHLNGIRQIGHKSALRYTKLGLSLEQLLVHGEQDFVE